MILKDGYELWSKKSQCEQMAQTVLVGKDLNSWEAYLSKNNKVLF